MKTLLLAVVSLVAIGISANASTSTSRGPRGTVYHIRPVNIRGGENPFANIEGVTDLQFPNFGLKSVSDSIAEASSSRYEDSTAEEAVELPKFLEVSSSEESPESISQPEKRDKRKKQSNNVPLDASYAFGYTLDDQTRHEVADPGGNVNGYYQYVDDEGYVRKVVYTAGPGKGFVVLNKERVKGPISPPTSKRPKHSKPSGPPPSFDISPAASSNQIPPPRFQDSNSDGPDRDEDRGGESDDSGYPGPPWGALKPQGPSREGHSGKKKKPIYIVKIRRPSPPPQPLPQEPCSEDGYDDGSYREEYQYHGTGSSEDAEYGHQNHGNAKPDASYSFGYETETANRLEKADNQGNVRGSYSYIDSAGIKRTVHYIAGSTTGFQVLGSSPSAARSVRLEAPTGYVVSRRRAPSPTLATAEYRYPQQSAIVYHIHPDSQWKPWEATERRKPRKMRKVMRIRKKSKTNPSPSPFMNLEFTPSQKELDQSEGTVVIHGAETPQDYRPFRHSTRVSTLRPERFESPNRKRHASHRAYTDLTDSGEDDDGHRNDPILFSPNYEALNEAQDARRPIPNPILLKSSSVRVINRGSVSITSPLEVSESIVHPVRAGDGSEVTQEALVPAESINTQQGYTTLAQDEIIPVVIVTEAPATESPTTSTSTTTIAEETIPTRTTTLDSPTTSSTTTERIPRSSGRTSTLLTTAKSIRRRGEGQPQTVEPKTVSPTVVRMTREETVKNPDDREVMTMTSSIRLLQRLGSDPRPN